MSWNEVIRSDMKFTGVMDRRTRFKIKTYGDSGLKLLNIGSICSGGC